MNSITIVWKVDCKFTVVLLVLCGPAEHERKEIINDVYQIYLRYVTYTVSELIMLFIKTSPLRHFGSGGNFIRPNTRRSNV